MTKPWRFPVLVSLLAVLIAVVAVSATYGQTDCTEALDGDGSIEGEWESGCSSAVEGRGYARYYTFTLTNPSEVTISLSSFYADTYLYLREGGRSGTVLHENDDAGSTSLSRIQETLPAGSYTIEATTYNEGETGDFTLTVSGISEFEDEDLIIPIDSLGTGHIHHDVGRDGPVFHFRDVQAYDVAASAWFANPYDASDHDFSYGFQLRSTGYTPSIRFYVHSEKYWGLIVGRTVHTGYAPNLKTLPFEYNRLAIAVIGKEAVVSLNRVNLTDLNGNSVFHVGSETESGNVLLAAGIVEGTLKEGAITHFTLLDIYRVVPDVLIEDSFEASMVVKEISQQDSKPFPDIQQLEAHKP